VIHRIGKTINTFYTFGSFGSSSIIQLQFSTVSETKGQLFGLKRKILSTTRLIYAFFFKCAVSEQLNLTGLSLFFFSLYPDVERTMRNIDLLHNITPHGVVPRFVKRPF